MEGERPVPHTFYKRLMRVSSGRKISPKRLLDVCLVVGVASLQLHTSSSSYLVILFSLPGGWVVHDERRKTGKGVGSLQDGGDDPDVEGW